ncbi:hypothetical protein EJA05_20280 [Pseudomonas oryziphila]|uniref:Uncharacterized protein n=2 Tax=Pseudomonas TaxID=286 RepID=A0ABM7CUK7_9PSED|nr:hypothetical protein EJA05_20280 [Pseudomonas oryziphila]AZL75039.1 hypothetical protein EI693_18960 [Pseudomonas oryziphila]
MFNRNVVSGFHLASCRRFLGVNSVTNSGSGTGFLPVPIIRNEYWFEKIHIDAECSCVRPLSSKSGNWQQRLGKNPRMRRFPHLEHSGYAI